MSKIFALVDCNNFYASCERVFNPALAGQPVVVLSNNDGCIVARSEEVRAMGISMAEPYHKVKHMLARRGVFVFSSNYQLYGDMSNRVMSLLQSAAPMVEVYSIDEAFLRLDGLACISPRELAVALRRRILRWVGIPTSIGLAPTKTLAKIASHIAKARGGDNVFDICNTQTRTEALATLPVTKVWGISRGSAARLSPLGIESAAQLAAADLSQIRARLGVVGERIALELRGTPCLDLETIAPPKKTIISSRSFGRPTNKTQDIREALANHAARAAEKLRAQHSCATALCAFLRTSRFQPNKPQRHSNATIGFDTPTQDTATLIHAATRALKSLYHPDYQYHSCGLSLLGLTPRQSIQPHLFTPPSTPRRERLMATLDKINQSLGKGSLYHLSQGTTRPWQGRSQQRSPRYTTCWSELLRVH